MITVKCIEKFRNSSGQIIGYRLQDINGQTQDATSDALKKAIKTKQIHVVNLTLTSDNRLVDSNEKQLQSKALGKSLPQDELSIKCAKAMIFIDKSLMNMGDNLTDIVDNMASMAKLKVDVWKMTENQVEKTFLAAYSKISKHRPDIITDFIDYRFENGEDEDIEALTQYEKVSNSKQTKVYKALYTVLTYLKARQQPQETISKLENLLKKIEGQSANTIDVAYRASHEYFKHLNKQLFGLITNDFFTVGHKITASETKQFKARKGYEYVCHKELNIIDAPRFVIAMLFKPNGNEVRVDFKFARQGYIGEHSIGIVGYFMDITSIDLLPIDSTEDLGKKVANVCNKIAPKMLEMVREKPELGKYEPLKK